MVGLWLAILLVAAIVGGILLGRWGMPGWLRRRIAWAAFMLAVFGAIVTLLAVWQDVSSGGAPIIVAALILPLVLTGICAALDGPGIGPASLSAVCAAVLVAEVVVMGLAIGPFFGPAAIVLTLVAAARVTRLSRNSPADSTV